MTTEQLEALREELRTQDNACTAEPMFVVYQVKRIYGLDPDYTEETTWTHAEGEETDPDIIAALEALDDAGSPTVHDGTAYERVGYIDIDQFVTVCFTRKGAEEFIARMKHRLNKPHIDVDTFHRNAEMIALRNHLMGDDKP